MSNSINDNILLSCSTLSLTSGYCYCFVIDKDYKASRASFSTTTPGDERKTEKVQLFDDEQLVVNDFVEDFLKHDAEKNHDFDAIFNLEVNYGGATKESQNNQEWESKTYELINAIAFNHKELSSEHLHQVPSKVAVEEGQLLSKRPSGK